MNQKQVEQSAAELISMLRQLVELQEQLHGAIREKLAAMRRCDPDEMMAAAQREGELVAQVTAIDERRKKTVEGLCCSLDMPKAAAIEYVTLRALAARLDAKLRGPLLQMGQALRERMLKVAESNRVVEMVCREMLSHFKTLFSAFMQNEDGPQTYSSRGAADAGSGLKVLDAVG